MQRVGRKIFENLTTLSVKVSKSIWKLQIFHYLNGLDSTRHCSCSMLIFGSNVCLGILIRISIRDVKTSDTILTVRFTTVSFDELKGEPETRGIVHDFSHPHAG